MVSTLAAVAAPCSTCLVAGFFLLLQDVYSPYRRKHPPHNRRLSGPQDWDKISSDDIDGWEPTGPPTPLLDTVSYPVHIKNFNNEQLRQLCREIRSDLIHTVSQTGGHLGASLGVVELTVALHKVYSILANTEAVVPIHPS
jgi:hypothetical protein